MRDLDLLDTHLGLIIIYTALDGCGPFKTFFLIVFPLMIPLVFLQDPDKNTVMANAYSFADPHAVRPTQLFPRRATTFPAVPGLPAAGRAGYAPGSRQVVPGAGGMELRQLRYFVALAEELHFGRAAAREHVVQSALSQQLARLERELGVLLLDRGTHHVELTPAGSAFLVEARQILAHVSRAAIAARRAAGSAPALRVGIVDAGYDIAARWRASGPRSIWSYNSIVCIAHRPHVCRRCPMSCGGR